jgi:diguanylate cyclase (GGDEF)-like protein/PAS domain S-box-containing protein
MASIKKSWLKRLSVQVAVVFLSLTISAIALFTLHTANEETERTTASMLDQAKVLASNIASTSSGYLLTRDYTSIEDLLLRTGRFPGVIEAQVCDTNGRLLGDITSGAGGEPAARFGEPNLKPPKANKTTVEISHNRMTVWEPVLLGHPIGWVRVTYDLEIVELIKQRIFVNSILLSLLLISVTITLLMLILRRPLKSIEKYTEFSNRLDTNEGEQVKVDCSSQELEKLGTSLNHASERLHLQSQAIVNAMQEVERIAAFARFNPNMVISMDAQGEVIYMNPAATQKLQINGNEDNTDDVASIKSYLPDNIDQLRKACLKNNKGIYDIEIHVNDEAYLWSFEPLEDQQVLHCYALNISKRKKAETALIDSESRYHTLFDSANDAILLLDNEKCIDCNPMASIMFGVTKERIIGESINYFSPSKQEGNKDSDEFFGNKYKIATAGMPVVFEWKCYNSKADIFYSEIHLNSFELSGKIYVLAIIRDISDRKEAEEKLLHQANFDPLTGLPNRLLAFDRITQAIKRADRSSKKVALMFIDVDQFKKVNDTLGHAQGDKLLIEVGKRLLTCVREVDTLARLGGDEFLIVMSSIIDIMETNAVAERILYALSQPYFFEKREIYLSASIGITSYPEDSEDPQTLLRNADTAMYLAKDSGRNTFSHYTSALNDMAEERFNIETKLRHAITNNELTLNYQPQIDIRDGSLIGAEALIRWTNPELGFVPPDKFIPLAEDLGLMNQIGDWVLNQACRDVIVWQSFSATPIRVAVNVSPIQFRGQQLLGSVSDMLDFYKLSPELLELEMTESLLVEDAPETLQTLNTIKEMGIGLALDDFGTGYSSLSYLKRFPFDILKIDRAFINNIMTHKDDAALCKAIIAMASSLNLKVLGEGVEDKDQLDFLIENGAEMVQGYYYSKPLPLAEFQIFITEWNKTHTQKRQSS